MWFTRVKTTASGHLGVEFSPSGIALANVLQRPNEQPLLLNCQFRESSPERHAAVLKNLIAELGLAGLPVNLVLHPAEYQMLLLESPDVPAAELGDAMRWRIKDLIKEPLEDVAVDAFALPTDAYRGRSHMAYCAVLNKARLQEWCNLIKQANLNLVSVDVTEMAFRNIGLLAGADELNIAVLRLRASGGLLCVQHGAELYMARVIEHGLDLAGANISAAMLEIQRTLDYFESQLGKGQINRLMLLPMKRDGAEALQALDERLTVNVKALDLRQLFPGQAAADIDEEMQASCFTAVGAALRQVGP
ncbi:MULTISPECIES: MSHA biogenesis protein MshI [unclassified Pseudomonas]|uniref:MSHA biogenesis protein MshI n=1 Tax=unclassified Pseudomonas TaxID=196821 RepID=UPI002AC9936F|nr:MULTISPECIES: MSHA biogenesis protein MshI [unclassified Pseudomonas]MEB0039939.1 MSHA biogenesis protein MshI [Pseudomonas sp. MH10]MEB0078832.1 MSHA biogenesis protein MshI [Pseudomonas sp. MH10out]MEB0089737.1 MSHA biogenesis protein MshI [Pseudomonas sp. CCI4.2]MEB0102990.1 MSHA biogenesis protein MshI [Pseudomonas sp. CCI3.2]MEB0121533.1 MSHA biogenesis protein MshI [Pseudomonas sp. CCI1.2]